MCLFTQEIDQTCFHSQCLTVLTIRKLNFSIFQQKKLLKQNIAFNEDYQNFGKKSINCLNQNEDAQNSSQVDFSDRKLQNFQHKNEAIDKINFLSEQIKKLRELTESMRLQLQEKQIIKLQYTK